MAYADGGGHVGGAIAPTVAAAVIAWGGLISGFSSVFFMMTVCVAVVAILLFFTTRATGMSLSDVNASARVTRGGNPGSAPVPTVVPDEQAR
jgi:hypothetical protein